MRTARGIKSTAPSAPPTPLFRWAGSKRKVLPVLATYWRPEFRRYVEPFVGSGALFFRIAPEKAVLGDINRELMEAYTVIRDQPDDVHGAVDCIRRSERQYYRVRERDPKSLSEFDRAVRFVYLNRLCFNGIFRTNAEGRFNVPYAHTRAGKIPSVEDFRRCAIALNRAILKTGDFGGVLSGARAGDFVYIDPPYAVGSRRVFREYDKRAFTTRDLERLGEHLETLDRKGASFVLSYADCREARSVLQSWKLRRIQVRRNIAGFAGARRIAVELLATNIESAT